MKNLRGKTAVVTGASRGLGVHIASGLAERGVNLVLAARDAAKLEDTRRICESRGVRVATVAADVTSLEDLRHLLAVAEREFGAIDILVNNAGIEVVAPFSELSLAQIDGIVRTNLSSAIWLTKLVLPSMLARRSGAIVNVASLAGKSPVPYNSIYGATKAGLINFTNSLQAEIEGSGVSAGSVCPGFVSDAGMWADHAAGGATLPRTLSTVAPDKVVAGVMKVIDGHPEVIVNSSPLRPLLALGELFPSLRFFFIKRLGLNKAMKREAERLRMGEDHDESAQRVEAGTRV
jgi:short-subunit dehydrogenase